MADSEAVDEFRSARGGQRRIDHGLAVLYQATLDEPIPEDMLRLVEMIGMQGLRR